MFASYFNHNTIMHDKEHPQEESFSPKLHFGKVISLREKAREKKKHPNQRLDGIGLP